MQLESVIPNSLADLESLKQLAANSGVLENKQLAKFDQLLDAQKNPLSSGLLSDVNPKKEGESVDPRIDEVASQFESVFVSLLLKEMRNTLDSGEGGLFGGEGSDTLGGMFDMFMGEHLADANALGVGNAIKSYMSNKLDATPAAQTNLSEPIPSQQNS